MRSLAQIWADATPLNRFAEEQVEQFPKFIPAQSDTPLLLGQVVIPQPIEKRRALAQAATRNALVAGRFVGLGRSSDSKGIDRVSESFWVDAEIVWNAGAASCDGRKFVEIRVVAADVVEPFQPVTQQARGRPSEVKVICLAIADYAARNRGLRGSPSKRHDAHRSFISAQGYDLQDPGFDKKTLEKYEREFRKGNKQLFPD